MRIVFKYADSEEVAGSLSFDRDEDIVGTEPRRFIFTSWSGSSEHTLLERDTDVICRVYGLSEMVWSDGAATVREVTNEEKSNKKAQEAAVQANEKNPGGTVPEKELVAVKERSPVDSGDDSE